ncbi:MAG TPA: hypothetical protein VHC90_12310 [Bryobacteraceae bacterium]|nr:hypothetical protein [Bryobacteraceae bacterium]
MFIETFLSAYEDLSWADCSKDWVDRHTDGGIEMLATRKSDGKTLAIEHTVAEPFVGEIEDYRVFFEPSFLKLEADKSLVVPGRWIRVFVPARTLEGYRRQDTREGIVGAVRGWIKQNGSSVVDGEHRYQCPMKAVRGIADRDIQLTVKAQNLNPGSVHVRRQQTKSDFSDVIRNVMERKVKKLAKQPADKRVLILERQHMNLEPRRIMDEMMRQAPNYREMADIHEVWILETIGYDGTGHFMFELNDENDQHLATITCEGKKWTSRSGRDGIPICNY